MPRPGVARCRSWSAGRVSTCARRSPTSICRRRSTRPNGHVGSACTTSARGGAFGELDARPRAAERLHANDRRVVRARAVRAGESGAPARPAVAGRPARAHGRGVVSWPRADLRPASGCAPRHARRRSRRRGARCATPGGASATAARILGLEQIGAYPRGDRSLADVAAEITLRTGQYARRQETWARRIPEAIELAGADGPERKPTACWS